MEWLSKTTQENIIEKPKIKEGVDFVFEQHPELAEIGTKEQYSEYLDTVFPESSVRNIMYHETSAKTVFNGKDWKMSSLEGAYFMFYNQHKVGNAPTRFITKYIIPQKLLTAIVDVRNPFLITKKINSKHEIQSVRNLKKKVDISEHDALLGFANVLYDKEQLDNFPELPESVSEKNNIELAVIKPEQIHILGSEDDVRKFTEFVHNKNIHPDSHT